MRTFFAALTLAAACACHSETSSAESCSVLPETLETRMYFGNGIRTPFNAATSWAGVIGREYGIPLQALRDGEEKFRDEIYTFSTAYNETVGTIADVSEVLLQKVEERDLMRELGEIDGLSINGLDLLELVFLPENEREAYIFALAGTAAGAALLEPGAIELVLSAPFIDAIREAYNDYIQDRLGDLSGTNTKLVDLYKEDIDNDRRVILLAHSQGNLFGNTAIEAVRLADPENADAIGMYGVASPAGRQIRGADYITAHDDRIIDALRLVATVLPSNLDNDPSFLNDFRTIINHDFGKDYFDTRLRSRAFIDQGVNNLARTLKYPKDEFENFFKINLKTSYSFDKPKTNVAEAEFALSLATNSQGDSAYAINQMSRGIGLLELSCDELPSENISIRFTGTYSKPGRVLHEDIIDYSYEGPDITLDATLEMGDGTTFPPHTFELEQTNNPFVSTYELMPYVFEIERDPETDLLDYTVFKSRPGGELEELDPPEE